jgi:hypothetical protein
MTPITRKVVRITNAKHRGDAIVIELHATALFVRTKGSRESLFRSLRNCCDATSQTQNWLPR